MTRALGHGRAIYHLARADFLERVRRYSFLVTLAFTLYFGYLGATGKIVLNLGKYHAVYNAAYIGGFMAFVTTAFLTLAGFYVVKNSIERDRRTRVGQILAACSMKKMEYCAGKFLSNLAVLLAMVIVLAVAAVAMYWLRGDGSGFETLSFFAPFLFFAVPAMAVVAAMALFFETLPGLRGGFGNVAYFFVWNGMLALGFVQIVSGTPHPFLDWTGAFTLDHSMTAAAVATYPGAVIHTFALTPGSNTISAAYAFRWPGFQWTAVILLSRLFWLGLAILLILLCTAFFDRFDAARRKPLAAAVPSQLEVSVTREANVPVAAQSVSIGRLAIAPVRFRFGGIFVAELKLMLKGQHWWWYAVAAGLVIASATVPSAQARGIVLACAWIWPVLMWSAMGIRESRNQTSQLLFSAPHPIARQLPAIWLSGVALAILTGGGFALRVLIEGNLHGLLAWLIGALFIPTLALSLGVWSASSKPFEILYMLLWYIGPMHSVRPLDFMGSDPATASTRYPMFYLLLTCALAAAALAGRKRQVQI